MISIFKKNYFLLLIITLAILLRLTLLSSVPVGFNDDEAAFGYNAYSILKTGRDEWGRFLPFPVFESFGDWKLIGYLYPTVVSQMIFGTNELATRLPSVVFGVLAIISAHLLAGKLFNRRVGLVAALLLAVSPWHIAASRNAFESDILIFFITCAAFLFLKGLDQSKYFKFSFFLFILSFYIYRSAWLFVPLFFASLLFIYRIQIKKQRKLIATLIIISLILLIPLVPSVLTFKGQSRFFQESFITGVTSRGIVDDVNEQRGFCSRDISPTICKTIYNKYNYFALTYANNYFSNLSPQTYYAKGNQTGYQSFPDRGLFYAFELPLLIAGLIILLKRRDKNSQVLITWLLIVPLGASLTGIGNPGRLNILMPAPQIIEALGFISILFALRLRTVKTTFIILSALVIVSSISRLIADTFFKFPQMSARYQRYGYKELFTYIENERKNYSEVIVSRKGDDAKQYIHYLFSQRYDPQKYLTTIGNHRYRGQDSWIRVNQIENIKFMPAAPNVEILPGASLLVISHNEVQYPLQPIFIVYDFRQDPLYEVYETDNLKKAVEEQKAKDSIDD